MGKIFVKKIVLLLQAIFSGDLCKWNLVIEKLYFVYELNCNFLSINMLLSRRSKKEVETPITLQIQNTTTLPIKRVHTSTSHFPGVVSPYSLQTQPFSTVFFCHSRMSLICLIYLFLPNLYFYTVRSMTKISKVLKKLSFRAFT